MENSGRPGLLFATMLVVIVVVGWLQPPAAAQRHEASEMPEDCDQSQQYFDLAEAKCRNCSEVLRVFESSVVRQDNWSTLAGGSGAVQGRQRPAGANQAAPDQLRAVRTKAELAAAVMGSRLTPLPATAASGGRQTSGRPLAAGDKRPAATLVEPEHRNTPDAILSRLVLSSQQDPHEQPPLDRPKMGADYEDDRDQSAAGPFADSESAADGPQSFRDEYDDNGASSQERAEHSKSLAGSARSWHKLLWAFLQSDEIRHSGLLDSIDRCRSGQSLAACQMWANVCVMTMYSHSEAASFGAGPIHQRQRQAGSAANLRGMPSPSAYRNVGGNELRPQTEPLKTSWQQCPKFSLVTVCNSLRDWRRPDKQQQPPPPAELNDIFGHEDADGSLATGFGSPPSSPPLSLGQRIQVLAYEYAFDGRLVGVSQFELDDLGKFCLFTSAAVTERARSIYIGNNGGGDDDGDTDSIQVNSEDQRQPFSNRQHVLVGQNLELRCQFNALQANLLAPKHLNQTKFIDLFVGYKSNGAAFVKPVPVLVRNLLYQGQLVNLRHAKDPAQWRLVHRYFPIATVKLGQQADRKVAGTNLDEEEVLLFAKSAHFELKLRRQHDKGLAISSMLLVLDYDHLPLARARRRAQAGNSSSSMDETTTLGGAQLESRIRISQTLVDMQSYWKDLDLFVTIVCITSAIWTLIKCYNIQKYQGAIKLDARSLALFLVIAADIVANLLGAITFAFALFLFVALKFGKPLGLPLVLAPDDALEQNLLLKLRLALVLKLVGVVYKLAVRLGADVFFIDWERPRMLTSTQIVSQQRSPALAGATKPQQAGADHKPLYPPLGQQPPHHHQISFWRPYMIINRWLQMQTLRRQNLTLQLVVFVCLIEYTRLDQLATSEPNLDWKPAAADAHPPNDDDDDNPLGPRFRPTNSPVFRALILALVYVALASLQILYKKFFHEPMVRCPVREFVDLCSVGNVSLFAMLYARYGFYLHGRNANGTSDCGLVEMNVLLEREERDLCSRRGLLANSDQQTFVLVLPKIINDHYRKLLFRTDYSQPDGPSVSSAMSGGARALKLQQQQQQQASSSSIRSALGFPGSLSFVAGGRSRPTASGSFGSMRALIESVVARNRAINAFLINFLEHAYKDIDYSVRERRRFESLLMDLDVGDDDELGPPSAHQADKLAQLSGRGTPSGMGGGGGGDLGAAKRNADLLFGQAGQNFDAGSQLSATFFVDTDNSFASLVWLGLEWDLMALELLLLLSVDLLLGPGCLPLAVSLVLLANRLLRSIYSALARRNLVVKSMLDEKFLIGP
jgi:hypothetical protein